MHSYEDEEDLDGSEEREALSMVLANLGDSVKSMRRKRFQPKTTIKVAGEGSSGTDALSPEDPVAEGDGELSEAELAKLEELL